MNGEGSFFRQLRKTAADVDKRVAHLEAVTDGKKSDYCQPHAIKTLRDLEQELKKISASAEGETKRLKEGNTFLGEILSLTRGFLEKQKEELDKTQQYLLKYGYVPKEEATPNKPEPMDTEGESTKDSKAPPSPAKPKPHKPDMTRMPRPEDSGVSEEWLKYMKNLKQTSSVAPTVPAIQSLQNLHQEPPGKKRRSNPETPAVFHHNGILVTPSLIGASKMKQERHAELASPMVAPSQGSQGEMVEGETQLTESIQTRLTFDGEEDSWLPASTVVLRDEDTAGPGVAEETKQLSGLPAPPKLLTYNSTLGLSSPLPVMNKTFCKTETVLKTLTTTVKEPKPPVFPGKPEVMKKLTSSDVLMKAPKLLSQTKASTPPVPEIISQHMNLPNKGENSTPSSSSKSSRSEMPALPSFLSKYVSTMKENEPPQ